MHIQKSQTPSRMIKEGSIKYNNVVNLAETKLDQNSLK